MLGFQGQKIVSFPLIDIIVVNTHLQALKFVSGVCIATIGLNL